MYLRTNGDMMLWDLASQAYQVMAQNVVNYSLGPGRKGPFVWVLDDGSVHVALKQQPEIVTLPAGFDRSGRARSPFRPTGSISITSRI